MTIDQQLTIWDILETEQPRQEIPIHGALNVKAKGKITEFDVRLCTGDLVLIVAMIEDYIKGLDVIKKDDIFYETYYRKKFRNISEKIQNSINYDYNKALQNCQKKQNKDNDIGGEAMSLMIKKAEREAKIKEQCQILKA